MLWGEIKQDKEAREGGDWGCCFIKEIRKGCFEKATLYRCLKESCESLREHSREREWPGQKL